MSIDKENMRVAKAAGVVGAATLLSRIFGFVRDVVIAWFFGAGLAADAFFVAFRLPNLLRRLFAEGSFSIAFIPVFSEHLEQQGEAAAFRLAGAAFRMLSIILAVVSVLGILLAPQIIRVIAPGFSGVDPKFALTVLLTRIMFPYILFVGLVALCMGILNVLGHFAAPALAPVLLNLAMIVSVFWLAPLMSDPVIGLAWGVLLGGVLQLLLQVPFLIRKGVYFWQKSGIYHPGLKRVGALMLPTIFGAAVYQINQLVGTLLATLLPEGSVSYLYYADRLVQFPLGIFAIAMATAVLPTLSREAAARDMDALQRTFVYALNFVFFITVPAMVGLIVLREPIVALLFKRGAFGDLTVRLTGDALLYYAIGLWAFAAVRIVVSGFYALQDTRTPVKMGVLSVVANILFGIILMRPLAHGGLALATSLASMVNLGLLIGALRKRLGEIAFGRIGRSTGKTLFAALIMGVTVWWLHAASSRWPLWGGLLLCITAGFGLYFGFALLMRSAEAISLVAMLKKGVRRR